MSEPTTPSPADDASVPPVPPPPAPPAPAAPEATAAEAAADVTEIADNPYVSTPDAVGTENPYVTSTTVPSSAPAVDATAATEVLGAAEQAAPPAPPAPPAPAGPYTAGPAAPAAPQNPYAAPQNPYTAQPGYVAPGQAPMYGVAPAAPSTFNVLGLVALIAGGIGLLIGLIPIVGFFGSFLALVGVVLGIIGLLMKAKSKGLAIAGVIVSGVALLLSLAISIFVIFAVNNAVNTATTDWESSWEEEFGDDTNTDPSVADEPTWSVDWDRDDVTGPGSFDEPLAVGTEYSYSDSGDKLWTVKVGAADFDATEKVVAEDDWNKAPPAGYRYIIIPITVTNLQDEAIDPWWELYYDLATTDGNKYDDEWPYYPDLLADGGELDAGSTGTYNVIYLVPDELAESSTLKVNVVFETVYFALS